MAEDNVAVAKRWTEMFMSGNLDEMADLTAVDFVDHNPFPGQTPDKAGYVAECRAARARTPDVKFVLDSQCLSDGTCANRYTVTATYTGYPEWFGEGSPGRFVKFASMQFVHVRDGLVAEVWYLSDSSAIKDQLGIA